MVSLYFTINVLVIFFITLIHSWFYRHHYIDQIDPVTGEINFNIGRDQIDGYGGDFARYREEEENSVAYTGRTQSTTTRPDGYLLAREVHAGAQCSNQPSTR